MNFSWDFDREPCVIDEALIYNAIVNQGPKGEAGKLFKQQGVLYDEVGHIRMDYMDILQIDHLWIMSNLTKLNLSNNLIEHINNLETLKSLQDLDLSFNSISKIENIDQLINLKKLSLYENKISKIENLENLKNLKVFSIGRNKISEKDDILYLRKLTNIKSLNLAGNPICQMPNFIFFVYVYLPHLVYYEYRMVLDEHRIEGRKLFEKDLKVLEENEEIERKEVNLKLKELATEEVNKLAFVEYLGGDHLFNAMFAEDMDGLAFLQMGEEMMEAYKEYCKSFSAVTQEIQKTALEKFAVREKEKNEFEECLKRGRDVSLTQSREVIEQFLVQKREMFDKVKVMLDIDEDEDEVAMAQLSAELQAINGTFQELCFKTWHNLMQKELNLYESIEKVIGQVDRNLVRLIQELVEAAQASFTQLRMMEAGFFETVIEISERFFTRFTMQMAAGNTSISLTISPELREIMMERENLVNAQSASHDAHTRVIDGREDKMLSAAKGWLRSYLDKLTKDEIARNRNQIIEINHFLDSQKSELQRIMSTPMGLLMLPTEIQEALDMK